MTDYQLRKINQLLIVGLMSVCFFLSSVCEAKGKDVAIVSCKNLGKVTDIDNLLFQMYSNIDDQCLFEISTKKLEEIWGIPVLDYIDASDKQTSDLNSKFHSIDNTEVGIFLTKKKSKDGSSKFTVWTTNEYSNRNKNQKVRGWGGSIGQGKFPKLLPAPEIIKPSYIPYSTAGIQVNRPDIVYKIYTIYYWLNNSSSDQQPVLCIASFEATSPELIVLYSQALDKFQ